MSVHAMSWVLEHSEAKLGDRLVLLVLADHAGTPPPPEIADRIEWSAPVGDDDLVVWLSIRGVAREARLSERAVQYALRHLEASGDLVVVGNHVKGMRVYAFSFRRGGAKSARGEAGFTGGVQPTAPEPSENHQPLSDDERPPLTLVQEDHQESLGGTAGRVPKSVDRRTVTRTEGTAALAILAAFNVECPGKPFTSKDHVAKIVMRIREHPELSVEEHHEIIKRNLANPWWEGAPTPSVIYGNGRVFENAMRNNGRREPRTRAERKDAQIRRLLHRD